MEGEREMGRKTLLVLLFFETRRAERDGEKDSTCGGGVVFQDKTERDGERNSAFVVVFPDKTGRNGEKNYFCCCFSGQDWQAETEIRRETLLLLLCFRTKLARRSSSKLKPKTPLLCIGGAFKGSGDSVCVCVYVHVGRCMRVCVYVYALNKLCTCHVQ